MNTHTAAKAVAALALVGVAVWWYLQQPKEAEPPQTPNTDALTLEAAKDTDGDGLKDWEELLFGFDPTKKDTDGDGRQDAEEYQALKAETALGSTTATSTSNFTDTVTRRIFSAYVAAKTADVFDREAFADLMHTITAETVQAFADEFAVTRYTRTDITTTVTPSAEAARQYKYATRKALAPVAQLTEYELSIYARAIEQNDETAYKQLQEAARAYQTAAQNLLVVPVPEDVLETHLQLVNGFAGVGDILLRMGNPQEDPLKMQVLLRAFRYFEAKIQQASTKLRIYFSVRYHISENAS